MPSRKKGGQRLLELARKRRQKAAKDKADRLAPMVIEPTLSKLRTGTTSKRKKGGQRLLDLARRRKKPAAKPASSQPRKFGARIPVGSRSSATKAQKRKTTPTRKPHRTPAQRAADKKKLLAEQKKVRAEKKPLGRFIPGSPRVKGRFGAENVGSGLRVGGEVGLAIGALAGSGGTAAPALAGTRGGKLVLSNLGKVKTAAGKAKTALSKLFKGKPKPKPKPKAKKKKVSGGMKGVGETRTSSAAARTIGLGKSKPPKPKAKKKKKLSAAEIKRRSMRGGSQWR